jgi:hypothetical protein
MTEIALTRCSVQESEAKASLQRLLRGLAEDPGQHASEWHAGEGKKRSRPQSEEPAEPVRNKRCRAVENGGPGDFAAPSSQAGKAHSTHEEKRELG